MVSHGLALFVSRDILRRLSIVALHRRYSTQYDQEEWCVFVCLVVLASQATTFNQGTVVLRLHM